MSLADSRTASSVPRPAGATPSGGVAVRTQQLVDGVPVMAGELVVNLTADNEILSVSGEALPGTGIDTDPTLPAYGDSGMVLLTARARRPSPGRRTAALAGDRQPGKRRG